MSRVYFHSLEHDTAELRGSERAHMASVVSRVFLAAMGDLDPFHDRFWVKQFFPQGHYIHSTPEHSFVKTAEMALRQADGDFVLGDKTVNGFGVMLNSAIALGNDVIRLMARLHAQCELHCWIEGQDDKTWVAQIIERGLKTGLLRDEEGWDDVVELLRKPDDSEVVCSFSVSDDFPNFGLLPEDHPLKVREDDDRWDEFYDMDYDEQWNLCFQTLKASGQGLQITQRGWEDFYFNDGTSAFTMLKLAGKA